MTKNDFAHPLIRFVAHVLDSLIFAAGIGAFWLVSPVAIVFWLPVYGLLTVYLTSKFGGSIGQILVRIEVVDGDGKYLTFKMAFFRTYVVGMVAGLLFGLGYLWILRDENRQGWHDKISGAFVRTR